MAITDLPGVLPSCSKPREAKPDPSGHPWDCSRRSEDGPYQSPEIITQQDIQMTMEGQYRYITIERQGSDGIYVITLRKPPENRLDVACCQELIRAYHSIHQLLGPDSEGAVILRGENAKFFCTVGSTRPWAFFANCSQGP